MDTRPRPAPKDATVSRQMSRMPRASTKPEVSLRRVLHSRGLRFRIHRRDLPGTPDIALPSARLAVFVDGCFWHACPDHGSLPKNNREWWAQKFSANVERDRRQDVELAQLGWTVLRFWEHTAVEEMADAVVTLWLSRTGRT